MMAITVLKGDGVEEKFDPAKAKKALRRSGLNPKEADEALKRLMPSLYDGIGTHKIYRALYGIVDEMRPEISHKYNLKRALQRLGPAGYNFEDFTSTLLGHLGHDTKVRQIIMGRCVSHEIDVVAKKGRQRFMIECKFRHQPGFKCRIQTALYVYARFLDLNEGAKMGKGERFTRPWLITNAKFSYDVKDYARCRGIDLLGWRYPFKKGLEVEIDRTKCYPVSVLNMGSKSLSQLLKAKMVTVFDIPEKAGKLAGKTGMSLRTAKKIIERADYAR